MSPLPSYCVRCGREPAGDAEDTVAVLPGAMGIGLVCDGCITAVERSQLPDEEARARSLLTSSTRQPVQSSATRGLLRPLAEREREGAIPDAPPRGSRPPVPPGRDPKPSPDQPDNERSDVSDIGLNDVLGAQRDAIAMAWAAAQEDQAGVQAIWDSAKHKNGIVWHLARLPGVVLAASDHDPDRILRAFLEGLPLSADEIDTEEDT